MNNEQCKSTEVVEQTQEQSITSTEEVNDVQLQSCQNELQELKDTYLRTVADFANYKRRTEKEQLYWMDSAQSRVLLDLLDICDNFERALDEHRKSDRTSEMESWIQGYELIGKELQKLLTKYNVQEISNYSTFDPEIHEALMQVQSTEKTSGDIVEVMQKGFTFKGALLRPAKVSVVT